MEMPAHIRDKRDRASDVLLLGLMGLLPLVAVFGHRGVAPWLLLAALPAFVRGDFWQSVFGRLFDRPEARDPFFGGFLAVMAFCAYIFASGFWSPHREPALAFWVLGPALVGGVVIWLCLQQSVLWARRIGIAYVLAVFAGCCLLFFEGMTNGLLRDIFPPADQTTNRADDVVSLGRGVTVFTAALFPAAAIIYLITRRFLYIGILFAAALGASASHIIIANLAAVIVGGGAAIAGLLAPRMAIRIAGWTLLALLAVTPLIAAMIPVDLIFERGAGVLPTSWLQRLAVWQSVGARIPEGLPFGFGADFAREWKETAPKIFVPGAEQALSLMPTHPHNLFLQIWLETGLPGVILVGLFIFAGFHLLAKHVTAPLVAAGLLGALGAIYVSLMVESSLWQVWRFAAIALAGMGVALSYSINQGRAG